MVKAKPLSESVKTTLKRKAREKNAPSVVLYQVYRRGQGAYLSSGSRPGVSMSAWAMGRVNAFLKGSPSFDKDLWKRVLKFRRDKRKRKK